MHKDGLVLSVLLLMRYTLHLSPPHSASLPNQPRASVGTRFQDHSLAKCPSLSTLLPGNSTPLPHAALRDKCISLAKIRRYLFSGDIWLTLRVLSFPFGTSTTSLLTPLREGRGEVVAPLHLLHSQRPALHQLTRRGGPQARHSPAGDSETKGHDVFDDR